MEGLFRTVFFSLLLQKPTTHHDLHDVQVGIPVTVTEQYFKSWQILHIAEIVLIWKIPKIID